MRPQWTTRASSGLVDTNDHLRKCANMANLEVGTILKAHCGDCGGVRNSKIRGLHIQRYSDDYHWTQNNWYIFECCGCEHVFVKKVHTNSEEYTHEDMPNGEWETVPIETESYWPAVNSRVTPDWVFAQSIDADGADGLGQMLSEVYGALNSDHAALAAIGIRTCFDLASETLGIDPGLSFDKKLAALEVRNHISLLDIPRLKVIVDGGSASAHRGWRPSNRQIDDMMDILEHFIFHSIVEPGRRKKLNEKAEKMARGVPPRPKRKPTSEAVTPTQAQADPHTAEPEAPRNDPA